MASPVWKILYEQHPMPLEGTQLTQKQILAAQGRGDLGKVVVAEKVGAKRKEFAIVSNGKWMVMPGHYTTNKLRGLLERMEDYRSPLEDDSDDELPPELVAVAA